jgi:hypothetical protein
VADALRLSPRWRWDWVEVDLNQEARRGGDSGKSRLDFYTRGFPDGLDVLMRQHPEVVLDGHFCDISMPLMRHRKLQNNLVLAESDEEVEWEEGQGGTLRLTLGSRKQLYRLLVKGAPLDVEIDGAPATLRAETRLTYDQGGRQHGPYPLLCVTEHQLDDISLLVGTSEG